MRQRNHLKRCYLLILGCGLCAGVYFLLVTIPLIRQERALDERLFATVETLRVAGHGMSKEEVGQRIETLRVENEALTEIGADPDRTIQFSADVEAMLARPFQLLDFDRQRFVVVDRIRSLSREKQVKMVEDWERKLPAFGSQPSYQLWAQLTAMDQLVRTAIGAGVESIDGVELIVSGSGTAESPEEQDPEREVLLRMQLTGPMQAIHSVVMMLPLNGEELETLGMTSVAGPKSSFFLKRFILKKSSTEKTDQVKLDFVVSGLLDAAQKL